MLGKLTICALLGLAASVWTTDASAQSFPTKPIRLLVGFSPGGSADVVARIFAQRLTDSLGQPVLVENRTGAAGAIAADVVAKGEPDGYRILMLPSSTFVNSVLSKTVPYNILRDFTPITYIGYTPLVLVVGPTVTTRSVDELIQLARSKPGQLSYGTDGTGGSSHLAAELFSQEANVKLLHVPFKSAVEGTAATAGGQVDLNFPALTSALPLLRSERIRPVAVTSVKRSSLLPSIPTLDESGLRGFDQVAWYGFVGPVGMPKDVVDRLRVAIGNAANSPEVREAMAKQGIEIQLNTPEQFTTFMRESAATISRLGREANVKLE